MKFVKTSEREHLYAPGASEADVVGEDGGLVDRDVNGYKTH
jgi:hypothetical protein